MPNIPRKTKNSRISRIVNEMAAIQSEIEALEDKKANLRDKLLDTPIVKYETSKEICTVVKYFQTSIDWPALLEHLGVSDKLVKRFTRRSQIVRVTVKRK